MMEDRVDLPGLESVKRGMNPAAIWALLIGVPTVIISVSAMGFRDPIGLIADFSVFMLVVLGVPVAIWILVACRHSQYETDPTGLTIRGLYGIASMRWSDVRSVRTLSNGALEFSTSVGAFVTRLAEPCVLASAWQHMRRYLPEDKLEFGHLVEPFFAPVPNDLPDEIVWENPQPVRIWPWRVWTAAFLAFCAAGIGCSVLYRRTIWWWPPVFAVVTLIRLVMRDPRLIARRVTVMRDRLIVDLAKGRVEIAWDEVAFATWVKSSVSLRSPGQTVSIPYAWPDEALDRVLIAISRRLRVQARPVLLTEPAQHYPDLAVPPSPA